MYGKNKKFIIAHESYHDYEEKKKKIKKRSLKWCYDIIEGRTEQDRIIYQNKDFVLIPSLGSTKDQEKMHIIALVKHKNLMTLRDMRAEHIPLLESIKNLSLEEIEKSQEIDKNKIKIFVHYPPSAWLFHIHFFPVGKHFSKSTIEYSHDFDTILYNLSIKNDYYKDINMTIVE